MSRSVGSKATIPAPSPSPVQTTKFRNVTVVVNDVSPTSIQKTKFRNFTVVIVDLSPGSGQTSKFRNKTTVMPSQPKSPKDTVPTIHGCVHFPLRT